jgi:hypothetical protein
MVMSNGPIEWCVIDDSMADNLAPLVRREQAAVRRWRWLAGAAFICVALLLTGVTWQMLQTLWLRDALEEALQDGSSAASLLEAAGPDLKDLRDGQKRDLQAGQSIRQELRAEVSECFSGPWERRLKRPKNWFLSELEKTPVVEVLPRGPKEWRDRGHLLQSKVCPFMGGNRLPPPMIESDDDMPEESMPKPGCPLEP